MLTCSLCSKDIRGGVDELKSHQRKVHYLNMSVSLRHSDTMVCGQVGCQRTYSSYSSYIRHIKNDHVLQPDPVNDRGTGHAEPENIHDDVMEEDNIEEDVIMEQNVVIEEEIDERPIIVGEGNVSGDEDSSSDEETELDFHFLSSRFLCMLRSNANMTGESLARIMEGAQDLMEETVTKLRKETEYTLRNHNLAGTPEGLDLLNKFDTSRLFQKLKSTKGQVSSFKKYFGFVEAQDISLGVRRETRTNPETGASETKDIPETCQYVSIIDTLKLILSKQKIREHIESEEPSDDNEVLKSCLDGEYFKTHPFFQKYPKALRIVLYYDDFEVCNPLGSKSGVHKVGGFYFSISNMPADMRSGLGDIHVLLLAYVEDIKKYGFDKVLEKFFMELDCLDSDEGVEVEFEGEVFILRASIFAFVADTAAAHELIGLLCAAARKFCRYCLISREDLHNKDIVVKQLRTRELHAIHVANSEADHRQHSVTGVRNNSALHKSRYFHALDVPLFDIMHDDLEGTGEMDARLVLRAYIIEKKYFTTETLNSRIKSFQYGFCENKNKPSANITHVRLASCLPLKQSAMQMWCLLRVLPFLVVDLVPSDDPYLKLLSIGSRIREILFAPILSKSVLPYLEHLIDEHQSMFTSLFPEINFINKHHHREHYADAISQIGPLRHLWCMRFEGKHMLLKRHAAVCCNFTNIPKTLARFAQTTQCSYFASNTERRIKHCKGKSKTVASCLSKLELVALGFKEEDIVFVSKRIQVNGVDFKCNLLVVLSNGLETRESLPVFGSIEEIIVLKNEKIKFFIRQWHSLHLDEDLNAICVDKGDVSVLIDLRALKYFAPYSPWTLSSTNKVYVSLRSIVM